MLQNVRNIILKYTTTRKTLQIIPPWIIKKELGEEHDKNWTEAYEEVPETEIPGHGSSITSHVIYKMKTDENGFHTMKARIFPHGNKERMKNEVIKRTLRLRNLMG